MNRILSLLVSTALLFTTFACATTPPKQAALQGEGILSAIRDLTRSYEARDLDAFMDKVSVTYPDRQGLGKTVDSAFGKYQSLTIKLQYTRMLILVEDKGNIKATLTWEGEWRTSTGKIHKDGARTTFVFEPKSYKLVLLEGKNPFVPVPVINTQK